MEENIVFVENYFTELNRENIKYCILRNAEEVKGGDAHDIDMTVDSSRLLDAEHILFVLAKNCGWKIHLKTGSPKDDMNIKCYHLFCIKNKKIYIVHFDIFPTFTWNGYVLIENQKLLDKINADTLYHTASLPVEVVTKLFIRLLFNGYIKTKYKQDIYLVCVELPEEVKEILGCFLDKETSEYILHAVQRREWSELEGKRCYIVRSIKKNARKQKVKQKVYLMKKIIKKSGLMIAVEGTDGSGKSTIINCLPDVLGNTFTKDFINYYHWRPGIIKSKKKNENGEERVVSNPHAKKAYGRIKSFAKFMFFNVDYILGYWLEVRWLLAKGHLIIFDRYYYDYYLDKIRYRLTISDGILNFFKRFIPKPDITFLLIGDAQVLYERKKEISVPEIQEQTRRLLKNQTNFNNSKIIDVNQSIDKVVNQVSVEILNACAEKYKNR